MGRQRKENEDGAEPWGLEKPRIARDLLAGGSSRVVVDLPNLGVQFINIVIELCVLCVGLLGLEIYCNRFHLIRFQFYLGPVRKSLPYDLISRTWR